MLTPLHAVADQWSPLLGAPIVERFGAEDVQVGVRDLIVHANELEGLWPFGPLGRPGTIAAIGRVSALTLVGWWAYMLYDPQGSVCYVGQTGSLRSRLQKHAKNKSFTRWRAFRCETAAASRRLEEELQAAYRPYLFNDGTRRR